jgi:hypothetical protein
LQPTCFYTDFMDYVSIVIRPIAWGKNKAPFEWEFDNNIRPKLETQEQIVFMCPHCKTVTAQCELDDDDLINYIKESPVPSGSYYFL